MKIDPNAPAYSQHTSSERFGDEVHFKTSPGLTIRAEIASRLMAGILANSELSNVPVEGMAQMAVSHADALISELNKEAK